jgi:hypothetical protein
MDPNPIFKALASDAQIERTVKSRKAKTVHAFVAESGAEARKKLLEMLPAHAEVFFSRSVTMDSLSIPQEIDAAGRFDPVRAKLAGLDRKTQNREMQKLGATPEYRIDSVHALTETGSALIASFSGSQRSGYAAGAAHLIWVVGA